MTRNQLLSRLDELRYLSRKAGVYEQVEQRMADRLDAGEKVTGPWIMETTKAMQVAAGLVPLP